MHLINSLLLKIVAFYTVIMQLFIFVENYLHPLPPEKLTPYKNKIFWATPTDFLAKYLIIHAGYVWPFNISIEIKNFPILTHANNLHIK